jgi:hypothetical protein
MFGGPFQNQRQGAPWQAALQNLERPDIDLNFRFAVDRMEVRRSVILPEHLDRDAVEK